jgi:hypothetical protein
LLPQGAYRYCSISNTYWFKLHANIWKKLAENNFSEVDVDNVISSEAD